MSPLVSVVIPCYHSEKYIRQCVGSLLAQTYGNWEAVFVDDKPSKEMIDIMEEYSNRDSRIRYSVWWRKTSPACARNRGVAMAHGDYIAFLDADDWWYPEKLSKQVNFMENHPRIDWCWGRAIVHIGLKERPYLITSWDHPKVDEMIPFQSFMLRKSLANTIIERDGSLLDETLPQIDDYDLFIRLKNYPNFGFMEPLTHYRLHNKGLTTSTPGLKVTRMQIGILWKRRQYLRLPEILWIYGMNNLKSILRPYKNEVCAYLDKRRIMFQIEPTTRCNLNCTKCSHKTDTPVMDITTEVLRDIFSARKEPYTILLQGLGEPFLHPNFTHICNTVKLHCKHLIVITNGTAIGNEAMELIRSGVIDHIVVSLDTLNPVLARQTRGNNYDVSKVAGFIKELVVLDRPTTAVNFVRSVYNFNEQKAVQDFCDDVGVFMNVTPIQNFYNPEQPGWFAAHAEVLSERMLARKSVKDLKDNCPFLAGRAYYFDALGRQHPCCIRMRYDQVDRTEGTCRWCPA
jgi:glycosyltransferase involved in cell wall biosynthesis